MHTHNAYLSIHNCFKHKAITKHTGHMFAIHTNTYIDIYYLSLFIRIAMLILHVFSLGFLITLSSFLMLFSSLFR